MYGYSYDSVSPTDSKPKERRSWILGDIIHSEPRVLDYIDSSGNLKARYLVVGSNDGMLHVFNDTDPLNPDSIAINFGGRTFTQGEELFAFIPRDLLTRLQEFSAPTTHIYMVDGAPNIFRSTTTVSIGGTDYFKKTLVFGERRGGRSYWALDVTDPNPLNWKVKWQILGGTGGTAGFEDLGYTFGKPSFAQLRTANTGAASDIKDVVIFSGGYDTIEDGFPEAFADSNKNGIKDALETFGATVGGTENYDYWNPGKDSMGRGIFVVDVETGAVLFKATYGDDDLDGDEADDVTTGLDQKYAKMKYCFPADISVIPFSNAEIMMYAADIYGQIWRIRYDYFEDLTNSYTSTASKKWSVKRIFTANPGSSLARGDYSGFGSASLLSADAGRKAFYSPDVSYSTDWTGSPVLYFGTGDREHPRYSMISNRLYFLSDTNAFADERNLLNLTCDELDDNADADGNGTVNDADTTARTAIRNLLDSGAARGFYRILDEQGSCSQSDGQSHLGEAILSQPTVFYKNVYFTGYQPTFGDECNPVGNAYIYALDYSYGTAAFNYDTTNDKLIENKIVKTLSDTYRVISGSSIPSGVRVIMRDGHAAGLISAGGAVAGIGEDGSTNIPGPPGGISPILWETE
jgi:type IV pilus assembly protein PilY1